MLNFEQYKKDQDEAEAAYEAELRKRGKKHPETITPEELDYICRKNDEFEGKTLNKARLTRYEMLKTSVASLLNCDDAVQTLESPPDRSKPNAMVHIDFSSPNLGIENDGEIDGEIGELMSALALCDRFYFGAVNGRVRFSFAVDGIWEK